MDSLAWEMASSSPCANFTDSVSSDSNTKESSMSLIFSLSTTSYSSNGYYYTTFTGSDFAKTWPTAFSSDNFYRGTTSSVQHLSVSPFKVAASSPIFHIPP